MNLKGNIIFFLCFFPIFIVHSNLNLGEISLTFLILLILIILNFYFLKFLSRKKNVYFKLYISFVISFGLDNQLGLFNGVIQSNITFFINYFKIIYIPALLVFLILFFIIFFLIWIADKNKILKIFIFAMSTLFIFNIFDNTKNHNEIPYFVNKINSSYEKKTLVLIWDEMSGLNSLSSDSKEGKIVNKNFIDFFKKYNLNYHPNAYSISKNSIGSLSSLVNFENKVFKINSGIVKTSKNYFVEYEMVQNKFFENFNSISVIQNIHINYCKNNKVQKCYQYNPLNLKLIDANPDLKSKLISSWSLNGSIVSKFIWRMLRQYNLITSTLEPEGEKLFIRNILNYARKDLISNKFDLIFLHLLVPHKPYGFDNNCKYDVKLSNLNIFMDEKEHIKRHNIERNCVIKFMDEFLESLKSLNDLRIIILSDHGSRINNSKNSSLSTIFAYKDYNQKFSKKDDNKYSIQYLLKKIYYE